MTDLINGAPGTGKTYFIVKRIYDLCKQKEKIYKHIYTNINGFNYDLANEYAGVPDFVRPFSFAELEIHIKNEYANFQSMKGKKSDFDYDELCLEAGIYAPFIDSLIVIDECHLYFDTTVNDSLIRFLSYHRHFKMDIALITQGKTLINAKYLNFLDCMYKAMPASKRLMSSRFRYKRYSSHQEYEKNLIETISIPLDEKVSRLYNSGSNKLSKSAIKKFLFPVFAVALASFLFYKFMIADSYNKPATTIETQTQQETLINQNDINKNDKTLISTPQNTSYYSVTCLRKNCFFKGIDYSFSSDVMYKLINAFDCKVVLPDIEPDISVFLLTCDKKLDSALAQLDNNSKNTTTKENKKDEKSNSSVFSNN